MSLSNFLKGKVLSKVDSITAKASGALSLVDGAVTAVDSFFNSLFTNVLTGNNAITNLNFTYEEESVVSKDKIITSTAIDPLRAPITSTQDSPTFADAASNPSITKISSTQPNDLTIEPIGIEPPMAFKGQYPYVHTYKSESGHVKEVDDTPGQERLLDYHRSGTYQEIASDGRRVVKVVADNFEVIVGDDQVYIQGSGNMYVRGNMNITCLNDVAINVGGRVEINATEEFRVKAKSIALESSSGNIDLYSSKSINTRSGANTSIYAKSNMNVLASDSISVEAASNIAMEAKSKASIKTNDEISMDSAVVLTNMGTSLSTASDASVSVAKKTGLGSGPTRENTTAPSIVESVIQGIDDDEGAQIQALEDAVTSGRLTREEVDELKNKSYSADETDTTKAGETSPIATTANEIKAIPETGISGELKLSDKYRL